MLNSQYQVSEYNRKRGHIGGGVPAFNHQYMFNQPSQNPGSTAMQGINLNEPSSNTQVLYGTNINSSDVQNRLRSFLTNFVRPEDAEDFGKEPLYVQKLREIHDTEQYILDIDCDHIYQHDNYLYS